MIRAQVITCSDGVTQGVRVDRSGPALQSMLKAAGFEPGPIIVVPDEADAIAAAIVGATAAGALLIVTTGGTGIAPRDVTPEATLAVSDRIVPGFGELIRARSQVKTPMASLSRAQATTRGAALIVNLPGSTAGATESLEVVLHLVPHALELLSGSHVENHPQKKNRD